MQTSGVRWLLEARPSAIVASLPAQDRLLASAVWAEVLWGHPGCSGQEFGLGLMSIGYYLG